ncbi:alpha/beta hydrolase [Massilia sp. PAMC28688]|uniref:alpha/beta fold hydrolase n=1 Tax=Massilia sp. PAMC28688 TaxID=2861283 RepID=UPI001C62F664|nr:alpha/beta hydrolase [Massilia sp. PAMC28688]QYF93250.1 alpha/beta hydrolase [Massilia sp. PAMC28688]
MKKPLIHFSHGNSYPAGTYQQFFDHLGEDFEIRSVDMYGHDPRYPVTDGWPRLVDHLIDSLATYGEPVILVGHSLGGMLSMMAAKQRPDLVRCVVMLDSPVVAGWRAVLLRMSKGKNWSDNFSPAKFSKKRRNVFPDIQAAHDHFMSKPMFAAWSPGVLRDYLEHGLEPHAEGVQLRFRREIETEIYRGLPHHLGSLMNKDYPVPIGFVGGVDSVELRQAGLGATRALVKDNFSQIEGGHLFPMERPEKAARLTREMIARLLKQAKNSH